MRLVLTGAGLLVVWLAVLESATVGAVIGGVIVCGALTLLHTPQAPPSAHTGPLAFRPLRIVTGIGYFTWQLLHANVEVAKLVISPRRQFQGAIVRVDVAPSTDVLFGLVANAVSLTPGTLILELDNHTNVMFVHVLDFDDIVTRRVEVLEMQRRILAAFGSADAIEANAAMLRSLREEAP